MKHKIVAIKMRGHGDVLELIAMTQSPRGTRVIAKAITIMPALKTRESRKEALELGVAKLLEKTG